MKFDGELTLKNNLPYSAEDIARINAIDLSDPNSIAAINSIDNTISKLNSRDNTIADLNSYKIGPNTNQSDLPTRIVQDGKILWNRTYGRLRWKNNEFVQYSDGVRVERVLQQEVISEYMGEPTVTEWVTVPTENE